jgi:hypothetical protein
MKYLKRFNEELKSSTYKSAANKLKGMGHIRRAGELDQWAIEVQNKEKDARELENFKSFKHDVPFKINLVKVKYNSATKSRDHDIMVTGNFYLKPSFDFSWAQDQYNDNADENGNTEYSYYMPFEVAIMPADDEAKELFRLIEDKLSDEVYEGAYWLQRLYYKIINDGAIEITPTGEFSWEPRENDEIMFENRSEALRFKKMFVDAVNGRNTFGNSKWCPNMHEKLKKFFLGEWLQRWNSDTKSYEKIDRQDVFNEEAFKRFLDSTNRMSVNQLYKN